MVANVDRVETAIRACVGVQSAAVERDASSDDEHLVAYVVMDDRSFHAARSLRAQLVDVLQPDAIPRRIIALTEMPATAAGEIDRAALPACYGEVIEFGSPFVGPRTDLEHAVSRIWSEVFGIDRIGIDDDFFELGGHSLLAMQILWRVEESFDVALDIDLLFDARTVRHFASIIGAPNGSMTPESSS